MNGYGHLVIHEVIYPHEIAQILPALMAYYPANRDKGQSGAALTRFLMPQAIKDRVENIASDIFGRQADYHPIKSSFRIQGPGGESTLAPHQDATALGISRGNQIGLTLWIPLVDIDGQTPTIAMETSMGGPLWPHIADQSGYAVLPQIDGHYVGPVLEPITALRAGDAIPLAPNTIHASYTPLGAVKTRMSLDLRLLPRPYLHETLYHGFKSSIRKAIKAVK